VHIPDQLYGGGGLVPELAQPISDWPTVELCRLLRLDRHIDERKQQQNQRDYQLKLCLVISERLDILLHLQLPLSHTVLRSSSALLERQRSGFVRDNHFDIVFKRKPMSGVIYRQLSTILCLTALFGRLDTGNGCGSQSGIQPGRLSIPRQLSADGDLQRYTVQRSEQFYGERGR